MKSEAIAKFRIFKYMEHNIFDLLLTTWWLVPAAYQGLRNETIFPKEVSHHRHKNTFTWEQVFDKYTFTFMILLLRKQL